MGRDDGPADERPQHRRGRQLAPLRPRHVQAAPADAPPDAATYNGRHIAVLNGTTIPERWRQFAEVAGDAGIYSVLSFPMQVKDEVVGALNFYSTERDALRSGQKEEGSVYAAQAAVTLANAKEFYSRGEQVEQLEDGLVTRTMIGQATGLLMALEGLSSEEAFEKLVQISQASNARSNC